MLGTGARDCGKCLSSLPMLGCASGLAQKRVQAQESLSEELTAHLGTLTHFSSPY